MAITKKVKLVKSKPQKPREPKLSPVLTPTPYRWKVRHAKPLSSDPSEIDVFGRSIARYEGGTVNVTLPYGNEIEIRMEAADGVVGLRIRSIECSIDVQPSTDNQVIIKPRRKD
jgi:heme/copper-type cytochrome/quinol oxidase subunit 2